MNFRTQVYKTDRTSIDGDSDFIGYWRLVCPPMGTIDFPREILAQRSRPGNGQQKQEVFQLWDKLESLSTLKTNETAETSKGSRLLLEIAFIQTKIQRFQSSQRPQRFNGGFKSAPKLKHSPKAAIFDAITVEERNAKRK